jgi:hypothetical protein
MAMRKGRHDDSFIEIFENNESAGINKIIHEMSASPPSEHQQVAVDSSTEIYDDVTLGGVQRSMYKRSKRNCSDDFSTRGNDHCMQIDNSELTNDTITTVRAPMMVQLMYLIIHQRRRGCIKCR